jgi:mycofactocin precursor
MPRYQGVTMMDKENAEIVVDNSQSIEEPRILEEIAVEELSIDGICGVY